jgi:hypothetical protein
MAYEDDIDFGMSLRLETARTLVRAMITASHDPDTSTQTQMDLADFAEALEAEIDAKVVKCSTCGEPATFAFGVMDEFGTVSSVNGLHRLSPACDQCAGREDTWAVGAMVSAPLEWADRKIGGMN